MNLIRTRVILRASRLAVEEGEDGRLILRLTAPPSDGQANEQARALLAAHLKTAPSRLILVRGRKSREKVWRLDD